MNLTAVDAGGVWSGTGITNSATGTFDPATAGPGSHIITYTISGSCGATDTETIVVNATDDPSFTYASGSFCLTDPNPSPTITGLTGGTFTIDNGGVINASTGVIDIAASGAGSYTVTYTTNGPCPTSATFAISLSNSFDATITPAGPFCENDPSINLTAVNVGGTWSGTGITDATNGTFDPATAGPGSHVITYTIPGSCGDTDTETIIVNAVDDPSFSYSGSTFCIAATNPIPTITGTSGGTFTIDNGGIINATTGEVDMAGSGTGSYTVTYTTNGTCPSSSTATIVIANSSTAVISAAGPFCMGTGSVILSATGTGGIWSGTGIVDSLTGEFDPTLAGPGPHDITYTISGACGASDMITIDVFDLAVATVSPNVTIDWGSMVQLQATGGGTYSWSPDTDLSCNDCPDPIADPTENITYCVTVVDTNACSDSACVTVTVSLDIDCGDVFVPNAFSPDGNGNNDLECVYGSCIVSMYFRIYDRWGEMVFETNNKDICWDGRYRDRLMSTGVYVYILDATLITGEEINKKGNITLTR